MSNARGDTWACSRVDEGHKPPSVYVQWKGTEVCLDFSCTCGYAGHYDGGFAYGLKCAECGQIWTMPHTFGLIPGGDDGGAVQDTDWPHSEAAVAIRRIRLSGMLDFALVSDDDDA